MTPKSLLSIATGAGLGVLGAVFLQMDPAEQAAAREPAPNAAAPKANEAEVTAKPLEAPAPEPKPVPAEPAVLTASQRMKPALRPSAEGAPETPAEVTRAEMACDARDKAGCLRAAVAYETGAVVPQNLALARSYRKRELTLVVRGCDARSPAACATLSDRYARGEGVEQSQLKAEALMRHAHEICKLRRSRECDSL